jgi:LmbE family N-acetylglucosaminyl deacetylase
MFAIFRLARKKPHPAETCLVILLLGLMLSLSACSRSRIIQTPAFPTISFLPTDRVLILAPHPDDEVIACAGVIQGALAAKCPVQVVFLTYGDGNQWAFSLYRKRPVVLPAALKSLGLLRHDEALAALASLGLPRENVVFLGYPDFSSLDIWETHWGDRPPRESLFTHATAVPYSNAFRAGAPYKGDEILLDLETLLRRFRPTRVFVSHPADDHPDHKALYLFARVALWDVDDAEKPVVYPFLVHHGHWPQPQGYHPDVALSPPTLPVTGAGPSWFSYCLSPGQIAAKYAALSNHRSQFAAGGGYLLSFVRPNELFADLPVVALAPGAASPLLPLERAVGAPELPEDLLDEERVAFVGVVDRSVGIENGNLTLSVTFSRPLGDAVGVSAFLFGYRHDRPFPGMPKLHVRFGALNHEVYDQDKRLSSSTVQLSRSLNRVTIRVPLQTLGNPDRAFTSVRTYLSAVPLEHSSWRILQLPVPAPH